MKNVLLLLCLLSGAAQAAEMPQSAREIGCAACHALDHKLVGPAWMDVSKRYREARNDRSAFNELVKRVSQGGYGEWGDMPMAPADPTGAKHDKIVELVKFILALSEPDAPPGPQH